MKNQSQNDPNLLGVLSRIQQQLAALDRKVDTLISKSGSGGLPPIEARPAPRSSFPPPHNLSQTQGNARPNDQHKGRPMYRSTCADCKKECELPFKPSGDRPVYCKECFSRRKSNNTFKPVIDNKPKVTPPAPTVISAAVHIPAAPVKKTKKPAVVKKTSAKKKPVAKKKK